MGTGESTHETERKPGQDAVQLDLTNCDREPIHIPGSIQPHGALLVLRVPELTIVQVSSNTRDIVGLTPEELLEQNLSVLIASPHLEHLKQSLSLEELSALNPLKLVTNVAGQERLFDGVVHRSGDLLVLELEPTQTAEPLPFPSFYHAVRTSAATLQGAASIVALSQAAAEEVRKITGFDRVMIYRFDRDWHGEVIAEAKREELEPYLGLHYPATDIPRQARELYRRNWLRLIADVTYQPTPLLALPDHAVEPLDLSFSVLRSVSPIHIEYLKNMGVGASMSVSLLKNGQLWGLISCHHASARFVPYAVRAACEFLGQILSLQLTAKEELADYAYTQHIRDLQAQLQADLLKQGDIKNMFVSESQAVLDLVGAQGAHLLLDGELTTIGTTLDEEAAHKLLTWLRTQGAKDLFYTDSLAHHWPEGEKYAELASGICALVIAQDNYLLWTRPEVIQTVNWGGNPEKPVEMRGDTVALHPRQSFAVWKQTLHLHSHPWKAAEIEVARDFRAALLDRVLRDVLLQRSAELARFNHELEQSNNELDAFAYIASHDLKEPLRGIHNYAQILKEDYASVLDAVGNERVETLLRLSLRMNSLIEALLHYSRVGRVDLAFSETDLNAVLDSTLELLRVSLAEQQVLVQVPRPLPIVYCDRARVGEIFQNLLTNALKYTDKDEKRIEVGYLQPGEPQHPGRGLPEVFYVRDNGIGIREKNYETIFRIFKRLHGRDKFGGGAGAGLTIVKRIVERHDGSLWVESEYGIGTTFYFTLQKGI